MCTPAAQQSSVAFPKYIFLRRAPLRELLQACKTTRHHRILQLPCRRQSVRCHEGQRRGGAARHQTAPQGGRPRGAWGGLAVCLQGRVRTLFRIARSCTCSFSPTVKLGKQFQFCIFSPTGGGNRRALPILPAAPMEARRLNRICEHVYTYRRARRGAPFTSIPGGRDDDG